MIVVGFYRLATRREVHLQLIEETPTAPVKSLFTLAWLTCTMAFFWGSLSVNSRYLA